MNMAEWTVDAYETDAGEVPGAETRTEVAMAKTGFMKWVDGQLRSDAALARDVDVLLNEMKIEQELVALREKKGLSQRDMAKRLGTSQPYIAKLESGKIKNVGVRTLAKYATALGGRVTLTIEPEPRAAARTAKTGSLVKRAPRGRK